MNEGLLTRDELPDWFKYPEALLDLVRDHNIDFGPWQILLGKWLGVRHKGLKQRYPDRKLVPFARRLDDDDVACFDVQRPADKSKVIVIHDFASPGWERPREFDGFDQWLHAAKAEAKDWK
jgi:hypothetical protein